MRRLIYCMITAGVVFATARATLAGLYDSAVIWNEDEEPTSSTMHVCFKHALFPTEMEWIREDIEGTWGAESAWHFDWYTESDCDSYSQTYATTPDIQVELIPNDGTNCTPTNCGISSIDAYGNQLRSSPGTKELHICLCSSVADNIRRSYFHINDVFRFGQALALHSEQERLDTPFDCNAPGARTGSAATLVTVGPWDHDSIMDGCAANGHNGLLTPGDAYTIGKIYGAAFPYSVTSQQPNDIDVVARRRATTNTTVSVRTFTNGSWGPWVDLGGTFTAASPPASVASDSTRLDVFVASDAGTIMQATRTGTSGGTWSAWNDLGGTHLGGDIAAASRATNRLTIATRDNNNALAIREWDGAQWLPWLTIAGPIQGRPAVVVGQDGSVSVFAQSKEHKVMWLRSTTTGVWPSSWTVIGDTILGSPGAVAKKNTTGSLDIYVFVRGTDNNLYYREFTGTWGPFWGWLGTPSGEQLSGSPAPVSRDSGYLDVFVRGSNGQGWNTWLTPDGWGGWGALPWATNSIDASPVAIATSPDDMQVVLRDLNTAVEHYHCSYNRSGVRTCNRYTANMPQVWWTDNLVY